MRLQTSLVAVRKISSNVARFGYSVEKIERAAQLIIDTEGVINPIVLRRTSLETYEVIDGHFEYYAAVRAREISPQKGEMIQGIILEAHNEKELLAQVEVFRQRAEQSLHEQEDQALETRLLNLEKIFKLQFEELRRENRELKSFVSELKISQDHVEDILKESLSQGTWVDKITDKLAVLIPRGQTSPPSRRNFKKTIDVLQREPINLNSASAFDLVTVPQIAEVTASKIIKLREDQGQFSDVEDIFVIKGLKAKFDKYQLHGCFVVHNCFEEVSETQEAQENL
jgi:DNA uptake protein ComE-like DNA-binding protein